MRGGMNWIIEAADLAGVLGWTTRRVRTRLISTGAGAKRGGRWITTPTKLLEHWPEAFDAIEDEFMENMRKVASEARGRGRAPRHRAARP